MLLFTSDYTEGAHPRIMKRLMETNMEQTVGYGCDDYCRQAADRIRDLCGCREAAVHFLVGGTQTNATVIAAALRPYQGVLAAHTAHIAVHETGAIEGDGHKVLVLPGTDGKITAEQVRRAAIAHREDGAFEHTVQPKMVYISNPTELGTLYTRRELQELSRACRENGLYLYLDGARLAYGLEAADNDLSLPDIAACCDVFYIGGTKVGLLFGEAVVITNPAIAQDFRYMIKHQGGMLAKGRLLGVQFLEVFRDGLYFEMGRNADRCADLLREALESRGYPFLVKSRTNQLFPILPDEEIRALSEKVGFEYQQRVDETHSAVRFCTSWATKEEQIRELIRILG